MSIIDNGTKTNCFNTLKDYNHKTDSQESSDNKNTLNFLYINFGTVDNIEF